jgi:hypothetical protein
MRFAVAGASGFVGHALVLKLREEGHEVVRLVRRAAEQPDEIALPSLLIDADQRGRLEDLDGVVNLAGSNLTDGRWTVRRRGEILRSRVETTRGLVAVMGHLNHRPRTYVNASAVGYYGDRAEEELTEASGPGRGFLAEVCQAWEEEVKGTDRAGIRSVLLRFGMVLGCGGGVLARLLPVYRAGLGATLGDGRQWVSWIALDDVLGATLHALRETSLTGPVNAVAPAPVRNAEFSEALARVLDRRTFVHVPKFVLRTVFGKMADEILLASTRVRPQRLLESGFHFARPDLASALSVVV